MTMETTSAAATSASTASQKGCTATSASQTPRMVDAATAAAVPHQTAGSSASRPVFLRYAAAMATIRNISIPSRSVTTIIWPIDVSCLLRFGIGHESDTPDAGAGRVGHHFGDRLILGRAVRPQVNLRLRLLVRRRAQ